MMLLLLLLRGAGLRAARSGEPAPSSGLGRYRAAARLTKPKPRPCPPSCHRSAERGTLRGFSRLPIRAVENCACPPKMTQNDSKRRLLAQIVLLITIHVDPTSPPPPPPSRSQCSSFHATFGCHGGMPDRKVCPVRGLIPPSVDDDTHTRTRTARHPHPPTHMHAH